VGGGASPMKSSKASPDRDADAVSGANKSSEMRTAKKAGIAEKPLKPNPYSTIQR